MRVPIFFCLLLASSTVSLEALSQPAPEPAPPAEPAAPAPVAPGEPPPPTTPPPAPPAGPAPGAPPPPPPAYGYGYPPPYYGPPPAPPAPKPDLSVRRHDGFYLRMGIGIAYGNVVSSGETPVGNIEATFKGFGPAYELLIGGTLGSGFVLGGGLLGQDISEPKISFEIEGGSSGAESTVADDEALGVGVIGPFVDWFFDETGGAHAGAMIGLGVIGLQGDDDESTSGLGGSIWGGYDFFISDQWSLGAEGRLIAVRGEREVLGTTFEDSATGFQLLFTALLH